VNFLAFRKAIKRLPLNILKALTTSLSKITYDFKKKLTRNLAIEIQHRIEI
jgi:hypothetical protein